MQLLSVLGQIQNFYLYFTWVCTLGWEAIYENVCQRYISFRYAIHSGSFSFGSFIVGRFFIKSRSKGLGLVAGSHSLYRPQTSRL